MRRVRKVALALGHTPLPAASCHLASPSPRSRLSLILHLFILLSQSSPLLLPSPAPHPPITTITFPLGTVVTERRHRPTPMISSHHLSTASQSLVVKKKEAALTHFCPWNHHLNVKVLFMNPSPLVESLSHPTDGVLFFSQCNLEKPSSLFQKQFSG